jgi:hypothetical protein
MKLILAQVIVLGTIAGLLVYYYQTTELKTFLLEISLTVGTLIVTWAFIILLNDFFKRLKTE